MLNEILKRVENGIDKTLTARHHSVAVQRERAEMVLWRARILAALLAFLTPGWLAVDWLTIENMSLKNLALGRLIAGASFAMLALYQPKRTDTEAARRALAFLFSVAVLFFIYANVALAATGVKVSSFVIGSYSYLPFVIASSIALFPLTFIEAFLAAAMILISVFTIGCSDQGPVNLVFNPGIFWLLVVVTGIAVLASMTQLRLLCGFVDQSSRDNLTGCFTRVYGEMILDLQFHAAQRSNTPLTLVFADLDNFKEVNDRFGHEAGDDMLRTAARNLRKIFRRQDIVARWGGEEFVILMPGTGEKAIRLALQRLGPDCLGRRPDGRPMTFSLGVAERMADAATTPLRLIELADQRMYRAKKAGKNQIILPDGSSLPVCVV